MSNLFDKQRFLDDLMNCSESIGRKSLMVMIEVLKNQPAIEAESVETGRWIYDEYGNPHCSKCEHVQDVPTNYCSECGTDMRGDQNE